VGDDVMQLTGDRRPLVLDHHPGALLALPRQIGRAFAARLRDGAEPPDACGQGARGDRVDRDRRR
jgi:hypothetical protein